MRTIHRCDVERLVTAGAQLVEVLDAHEFEWAHLPGAHHLPLRRIDTASVATLDTSGPIVVYCNDFL